MCWSVFKKKGNWYTLRRISLLIGTLIIRKLCILATFGKKNIPWRSKQFDRTFTCLLAFPLLFLCMFYLQCFQCYFTRKLALFSYNGKGAHLRGAGTEKKYFYAAIPPGLQFAFSSHVINCSATENRAVS